VEGAYYAQSLTKAREEGRIGFVAEDPNLIIRLFADIGGTGAKRTTSCSGRSRASGRRFAGSIITSSRGSPLPRTSTGCARQGYTKDRCKIWLPHDGDTQDRVIDVSYQDAFEAAGYKVVVVPNQGKGAALAKRIEEGRRCFRA
jgi:phage terminase large subunit